MDFSDGTTTQRDDPSTKPLTNSTYEDYAQDVAKEIKGNVIQNLFRGKPDTRYISDMVYTAGENMGTPIGEINLIYRRILFLLARKGGKSKVRRNRKRRTRRRKA